MPATPYPSAPVPRPRPALPEDATGPGLAYHRLVFARRRSGWWTPLVTGLLGFAIYVAMSVLLVVGLFAVSFAYPDVMGSFVSGDLLTFDMTDPLLIAVTLVSIALMWPAYMIASLVVNGGRIGLLSSVAGRLRWGWLGLTTLVALAVILGITALSLLLPGEAADTSGIVAPEDNPQFLWSLLVIVLLVPFQAAAEEYVFRGYLGQAVGRWLKHPAWAILLPVPLFTFGHLYDAIGLVSVAVFAVAAGWLTWRTGGLEAAIALHIVNNLFSFLHSLLGFSDAGSTEVDGWSLASTLVLTGVYVGAVELLFRRGDGRRTLRLTPPSAPPVPAWPGAPYPGAAPYAGAPYAGAPYPPASYPGAPYRGAYPAATPAVPTATMADTRPEDAPGATPSHPDAADAGAGTTADGGGTAD